MQDKKFKPKDSSHLLESLQDVEDETLDEATPPSVEGEQSVSGDMAHPESDDNVMDYVHEVGIGLDADEDDPKELDIAGDVAAAERRRRGM